MCLQRAPEIAEVYLAPSLIQGAGHWCKAKDFSPVAELQQKGRGASQTHPPTSSVPACTPHMNDCHTERERRVYPAGTGWSRASFCRLHPLQLTSTFDSALWGLQGTGKFLASNAIGPPSPFLIAPVYVHSFHSSLQGKKILLLLRCQKGKKRPRPTHPTAPLTQIKILPGIACLWSAEILIMSRCQLMQKLQPGLLLCL